MDERDAATSCLLKSWHAGDRSGLNGLIERHLPWLERYLRGRLGPALREKAETGDFVQDALVEVLEYAPRFHTSDESRFRAIVARIVENTLRDKHDWYTAKRRDRARERPLPTDSVLELDARQRNVETPSRILDRQEREAWIRLGIELLDPEDREVIVYREWDRLSFEEIAGRLAITSNAARKRFNRALGRLSKIVRGLRRGDVSLDPVYRPVEEGT